MKRIADSFFKIDKGRLSTLNSQPSTINSQILPIPRLSLIPHGQSIDFFQHNIDIFLTACRSIIVILATASRILGSGVILLINRTEPIVLQFEIWGVRLGD
ncbi:MAG: hypothetical protein ACRC62_19470 [Microcoleus sp.]